MKERPILFSAPMVRAILTGAKTQTRRVVKPRKDRDMGCSLAACELAGEVNSGQYRNAYCEPGDLLWVRETHMDLGACFLYRADHGAETERALVAPSQRWRPAIHMLRAASRITLKVTGVRVERLQEISRGDAMAEGCPFANMAAGPDPREWFADLWRQINGPKSWAENPWVWVVDFRRIT